MGEGSHRVPEPRSPALTPSLHKATKLEQRAKLKSHSTWPEGIKAGPGPESRGCPLGWETAEA